VGIIAICLTCKHWDLEPNKEPCKTCQSREENDLKGWEPKDGKPKPHPDTVRFDWLHEQLTGGRHIVVNDGETLREATDRLMKEASE